MAEEITIIVDAQGNWQVEGHGFAGQDCTKLTKDLEEALGETVQRKLKSDYHRQRTLLRTK